MSDAAVALVLYHLEETTRERNEARAEVARLRAELDQPKETDDA